VNQSIAIARDGVDEDDGRKHTLLVDVPCFRRSEQALGLPLTVRTPLHHSQRQSTPNSREAPGSYFALRSRRTVNHQSNLRAYSLFGRAREPWNGCASPSTCLSMSCLPYTLGRWFLSSGLHDLSVSEAFSLPRPCFTRTATIRAPLGGKSRVVCTVRLQRLGWSRRAKAYVRDS